MTSANTMLEYNFEIGNSVKYVTFWAQEINNLRCR